MAGTLAMFTGALGAVATLAGGEPATTEDVDGGGGGPSKIAGLGVTMGGT